MSDRPAVRTALLPVHRQENRNRSRDLPAKCALETWNSSHAYISWGADDWFASAGAVPLPRPKDQDVFFLHPIEWRHHSSLRRAGRLLLLLEKYVRLQFRNWSRSSANH